MLSSSPCLFPLIAGAPYRLNAPPLYTPPPEPSLARFPAMLPPDRVNVLLLYTPPPLEAAFPVMAAVPDMANEPPFLTPPPEPFWARFPAMLPPDRVNVLPL